MIEVDHHVDIVARSAMARIVVSKTMAVPPERVWEAIADLGSHPEWMRDASSLVFVGDQRRGAGTRMEVRTRVGPLLTTDVLEVVSWEEGSSIDVAHQGLVKGRGRLSVVPEDGESVVSWVEELSFPWWLGGRLTGWLARPMLTAIWIGNLDQLEQRITAR
jgi:carbon monoxide dehydrogenase subunit G